MQTETKKSKDEVIEDKREPTMPTSNLAPAALSTLLHAVRINQHHQSGSLINEIINLQLLFLLKCFPSTFSHTFTHPHTHV